MEDITDVAPGASVTQLPTRLNIFGQLRTERVELSDGISYVELSKMTEGMRRQFLQKTSRPMRVNREGEAEVNIDPAAERTALLEICITGWDLEVNGAPWSFNDSNKRIFLRDAPVEIIDEIEKAARELNPFLLDEVSVEQLDVQIAELIKMRDEKLEEEAGKDS